MSTDINLHTHVASGSAEDVQPVPGPLKNDLFPELIVTRVACAQIDAAPRRVRRALETQIDKVIDAVTAFGFRVPILVRQTTAGERYEVVDGHIRLEAARRLGAEQVPCILVNDLSDADLRRLRLSLNKLQETGEWDNTALKIEFGELLDIGVDLQVTGFEVPEIDLILEDHSVVEEDAIAPDETELLLQRPRHPVSMFGDIWIAGDHRVLCGRAQDFARFAEACTEEAAAVIITDPPYNVKISGHVSTVAGRHAEFAEASGEYTRAEFTEFLVETLGGAISRLRSGGLAYVFMDWRHMRELDEALRTLKTVPVNLCIWVKHAPGMGGLYRSQHELVTVVRKPGAPPRNNVQLGRFGRNRSNVWFYGGATSGNTEEDDFSLHPTVNPVALIRDALLDVTAPNEIVIDCFLGSGSTLIAAETSHRRCCGVEIDPGYVDLALRRWTELTGLEPIHAATGETFARVADRRVHRALPAPTEERSHDG